MNEDGSPTPRQHGNGPKRVPKRTVESGVNKKGSKSKFHDPCCHRPSQIKKQLAFEFYEPTCGNSKQPSTSGTSSEVKPKTRNR